MNIPEYDRNDLQQQIVEDHIEDFHGFIGSVIEWKTWEDPKEEGILLLTLDKGTKALSEKQHWVLEQIVKRYEQVECNLCGEKTPWADRVDIAQLGTYCGYHQERKETYMARD